MGHMENWKEAEVVGQDKEYKDMTEMYDAEHGTYQMDDSGKAKVSAPLPNTPEITKEG